MASDQHVWQRQQTGKYVVWNDLKREVLKEYFGFLFVNIEAPPLEHARKIDSLEKDRLYVRFSTETISD